MHHSAKSFSYGSRSATLREIDRIAKAHQRRNWGDGAKAPTIAYHFVIDRIGRIFRVNELSSITWHAREANPYSVGVLALGDYEMQKPTILTRRAIWRLMKEVGIFLGLGVDCWTWHDAAQKVGTRCCGRNLIQLIKRLQEI